LTDQDPLTKNKISSETGRPASRKMVVVCLLTLGVGKPTLDAPFANAIST